VFGVNVVNPIAMTSISSPAGGWIAASEIHTNGLITSDVNTLRPIGRLAERPPTVDDGSITVLPDGRMRVVHQLRRDVTWHDGVPFTSHDLVFTQRFWTDRGIPAYPSRGALNLIESSEAPDDFTFVLVFRQPYYLAGALGARYFWPVARHIVEPAYDEYLRSGNPAEVENLQYWTSQYVGTGPFRVTEFDMGTEVVLQAYEGYFLGRPKVDVVRIRVFPNQQTLYSNILAGAVDIYPENTLTGDLVFDLQQRWDGSGAGRSYLKHASTRFVGPQWRTGVQMEPANLDVRVRMALYHALDRDTLAETLQGGHREMAAWEILPAYDPLYPAVKDGMRPYAYDPDRASAILRDAGWTRASDTILRNNADGRRFRNSILGAPGQAASELLPVADYWQRIGIDMEVLTTSPAQSRDLEYAASFPGWQMTALGIADGILGRLDGPVAGPQTRWQGNPSGYEDARALQLLDRYRTSLTERAQFDAMKALGEFVAAELPFMVLFSATHSVGRRTGVNALDDHQGGNNSGQSYGTYTRNAHLWDLE
jgi:ABC-type transport system substrate-binding protein